MGMRVRGRPAKEPLFEGQPQKLLAPSSWCSLGCGMGNVGGV